MSAYINLYRRQPCLTLLSTIIINILQYMAIVLVGILPASCTEIACCLVMMFVVVVVEVHAMALN